jgi:cyclophilin family peptidyl-prolyl cis-trans isomerase/HEAT repeat protein
MTFLFLLLSFAWSLEKNAADEIWEIESQRLAPINLRPYLTHSDQETRARAIKALGNLQSRGSIVILRTMIEEQEELQYELAEAIFLTPGSADLAVGLLRTAVTPETKVLLYRAIGKWGRKSHLGILHSAMGARWERLSSKGMAAAMIAIGELALRNEASPKQSIPLLMLNLNHWDVQLRRAAAFSLAQFKIERPREETLVPLLKAIEKESDIQTRSWMIRATAHMDLPSSTAMEWVDDSSSLVRIAVAQSHPHQELLAILRQDEHQHVRIAAVREWAKLGLESSEFILEYGTIDEKELVAIQKDGKFAEVLAMLEFLESPGFDTSPLMAKGRPEEVRAWAVQFHGKEQLMVFATEDTEPMVRVAATQKALELEPSSEEMEMLLSSRHIEVSQKALLHLEQSPIRSLEQDLWTVLEQQEDTRIISAALAAIASLESQEMARLSKSTIEPQLKQWLIHEEQWIRRPAKKIADARNIEYPELNGDPQWVLEDTENLVGAIVHTSRGDFRMEFRADLAPLTVSNFARLVESGFYNGLPFHRIEPSFVVQSGDPGHRGPAWYIPSELSGSSYGKGSIGMALQGRDTGGNQFFIAIGDQPHLDGQFPYFADVTYGLHILEELRLGDKIQSIELELLSRISE